MKSKKLLTALIICALLTLPVAVLAESAANTPMFGDYQSVGFLSDYSKIPATKGADGSYEYIDPDTDFASYNKLLVDRIKIWFKDDSQYKGVDPDELKVLTDYFYEAINKAVGDAYPMVKEPGPDVLRLRVAVTDLVPNKPEASVATLVVPFLWIGDAGSGVVKGDAGSTMFTGEATIEMEALDSVSSKQIAAHIETEAGKKYDYSHGITEGVSGYLKSYSKWDYTKKAMDDWAELLRKRLDAVHGKTSSK